MLAYLDASALAKAFVSEPGRATMLALLDSEVVTIAGRLSFVEVAHVLCRWLREGQLTADEAEASLELLRQPDQLVSAIVEFDSKVEQAAIEMLCRYPLRGADAVHLGSAITAGCELFVSADARLLLAAQAEQLTILNPIMSVWPPETSG